MFGFSGIRVLKCTKVGASYNSLGKTWVVRVDKKTWDLQFKGGGKWKLWGVNGSQYRVDKETILEVSMLRFWEFNQKLGSFH